MSETAKRYRRVAAGFSRRVDAMSASDWDRPAPCDGWVARDVVRHLVEWMPGMFFGSTGLAAPVIPSVDDDPAAAWHALDGALQAALDDPGTAAHEFEMRMGRFSVEQAIGMFAVGDILVHTWDIARAAGLDEALDADEVHSLYAGMSSMDESVLRDSGQFGPRVEVTDDADEQTRLIAYTGRQV